MSSVKKILFIVRHDLDSKPGGDTVQIYETKSHLERIGYEIDITHSGFIKKKIDKDLLSQYRLVHFFNLFLAYQHRDLLFRVREIEIPIVCSPIFWNTCTYEKLSKSISPSKIIVLKIANSIPKNYAEIFFTSRLKSMAFNRYYVDHMRNVLSQSAMVLPNAVSEMQCLKDVLQVQFDSAMIPNAARWIDEDCGSSFACPNEFILSVGRIEFRKNQLHLIQAMQDISIPLVFVGDINVSEQKYWQTCLCEIKKRNLHVLHIPHQRFEVVCQLYRKALLHIQPSWFETPGLSSLEAAALGCRIVCTNVGSAQEYFGGLAEYCTPSDPSSIRDAILKSLKKTNNSDLLQNFVRKNYTWEIAAQKTHEAYQKILHNEIRHASEVNNEECYS